MEEVNTTGNVIPGGVGDQGPNNSFNDEVSNNDPQSNAQNTAKTMLNTEINNLKTPSVSGITYKGNFKNSSIDTATRMFGNVLNPVPPPTNFNGGIKDQFPKPTEKTMEADKTKVPNFKPGPTSTVNPNSKYPGGVGPLKEAIGKTAASIMNVVTLGQDERLNAGNYQKSLNRVNAKGRGVSNDKVIDPDKIKKATEGKSDKAVAKFIQSEGVKPTAKKSTLTFTPKAPSARKIDPDVKAAKKEIRKGGNVSGGGNVLDDFGHKYGYQSDKAKELDNSRLVSRKKRQDNRSEYRSNKIDVKKFAEETAATPKQYGGGTYKEGKKKARQLNKEDRQEIRSKNRAERKRTKENRKESRR